MTREDKDSLVEMLTKIPITETRGSLLSAIGKLLRVIDTSESSILIPTLLKDKCEFDAYEMLTLAKILKASILGHNDLVEFYMSESSSQISLLAQQQQQLQLQQQQQLHKRSSTSTSTSTSTSASASASATTTPTSSSNGSSGSNNRVQYNNSNNNQQQQQLSLQMSSPSLRSSAESTSSSPSTPMPQAETIGTKNTLQFNNGDPDATIRLLLQIEQLKVFIPKVTGLFESIIELYKNSVDTITYQSRSHK